MEKTILLKNAGLLDEEANCILNQNVYVQEGKILKILPAAEDTESIHADETIDCSKYYVSPGLANLHTHTAMNIFKGIAEDVTADAWFNEMIWPYESKMTDEDIYVGTLMGIAEMINNGVTVFADHYFGEEQVLKAVKETGIRGDLAPTLFGMMPDFHERLAQVKAFIQEHRNDSDRISFHMGPHANYTCPSPTLKEIIDVAKELNLPIHLHVSEEDVQVEKAREETGLTPFGILYEAGGFDCKVLIGHGLWIEEEDLKYLRDDTWFAFCPKTYMKLASGKGGFFDYYKQLNYGFGTDGAASSNTLNPVEQARLFGLMGKYQERNSAAYTATEIWQHLMASHQAFSFGSGRLKEGAPADLVIWDLYQPDTFPFYSPISAILYSSNSQNVKYTMVAGEFLKYNGKLKIDTKTLMQEAVRLQKALLERGKGKAQVAY
ncbi:amidohydrolase family protein [Blautia wexlerae]|uniref:Amidohydrolase family protein n=1 Tax=Blautia wexlerae TaxID=418240 RepID=A0ABX2GRG6_9FIRM|nr:amidohydrolase family protein [Blautia wexlerae]NSF74812.1 amidohydrolase family protein [Blautia wexlerae]